MSQKPLYAFNRGIVSKLALARLDVSRLALAAEEQTNFMPIALGPMMLRPGLQYIATESGKTRQLEFVFDASDSALIELHDETMSVVIDDVRLTRPEVTAAISNGSFTSNVTGWISLGSAGTWDASGAARFAYGQSLFQAVTCNEPGTEHAIRVVVTKGRVLVQLRDAMLSPIIVTYPSLGVGEHSLAFTPTVGTFTVFISNADDTEDALVSSVAVESGDVEITTPWAEDDLPNVRDYQSGDVIFVCDGAHQQRKIIRYAPRSWSVETYAPNDGPFLIENTNDSVTIAASAITGDITLTASGADLFTEDNVGSLFRLSSSGQTVTSSFTAQNQFTNSIRVTGTGSARTFSIVITGTFVATVTLQYSVDGTTWYDRTTYTTATSTSVTDGLDNQIIYYRLGVKTGAYTSGTADSTLSFALGSITGVARITSYSNEVSVGATVLSDLGGTTATAEWAEGAWSDRRGWPSAVTILDGRLWWAGKDKFWGSVTDAYSTFDPDYEGDAGPVSRTIGFGPVDSINWLLPMDRLMAGTAGSELTCRSSAFDEPLTPTNFTPKETSTQGSARIQARKVDDKAIFVQRCLKRVYEMAVGKNGDYTPEDLTALSRDVCESGVVRVAVQRQPDTRLHCVLNDGTVAVLVYDKVENLICWVKVETDGVIEDAAVLPGQEEDAVYYVVKRTIDGDEVRYLEKWALESEAHGGDVNKMADSFVYAADAASTITGLDHLEGEAVVAWGGGRDLGTFTVSGGQIDLGESVTHRCAGLAYEARFKSAKLAWSLKDGSMTLGRKTKIHHLGLLLADTHANGLEFGPSFDTMDPLPQVEQADEVDEDTIHEMYDEPAIEFPGEWQTDARLCLRATAPRPCTVMAALINLDKSPGK